MKKNFLIIIGLVNVVMGVAESTPLQITSVYGIDSLKNTNFKTWYHKGDMIHHLENLDDHFIVETHVTGQWGLPDRLVFATEGLPFYNNKYYINGFRVDDRFQPGSTQYIPNLEMYDGQVNTHTAQLYFEPIQVNKYVGEFTYNFGQITKGNPAPGTAQMIHWFHRTAIESADTYKHITDRMHFRGAFNTEHTFVLKDQYQQHLYVHWGDRYTTKLDQCGLILSDPLYDANYYKVQGDGELPHRKLEHLYYRFNFAGQDDAGSNFLYNYNEVYTLRNYTASVYGTKRGLTTGVTWATNTVEHNDLCFKRNIIDADGESFEPWIPDGQTHELAWSVNYQKSFFQWLHVKADMYNSLFYFNPKKHIFENEIYFQPMAATQPIDLYTLHWQSNNYWSGLLENTFSVFFTQPLGNKVAFQGGVDFTLDAILLGHHKSKVSPNWQANIQFDIHPCRWFQMGLTVAQNRISYNLDQLHFFSNDYLRGEHEHTYKNHLQQTSYTTLDIPIHFKWGKHELVLQQSYKKFYHVWIVKDNYEVGYTEPFGSNGLKNSPYYFSQLSRYTFTGKRVMFSISWQSMQEAGYVGLGNGANSNTLGILSESTALPSTFEIVTNPDGKYKGVSRMDLDKGFVLRMYVGYNICKYLSFGTTLKWTDGKPFTAYNYTTQTDAQGNTHITIQPYSSRGTNPTDGDFGTRHGAVWHIDLHLQGNWWVKNHKMSLFVECYNFWDFANDLAEFAFTQDTPNAKRSSCILRIPTGLLATFKIEL